MKTTLLVLICFITGSIFPASISEKAPTTTLGIKGPSFTINGEAKFLIGISYYGGLGASKDFIRRDLDDMQRYGFNWIRVWANWSSFSNNVAAVTETGEPREVFMSNLAWLVADCDRRGIVVDVTLSRGNSVTGFPRLQTPEAHRRAVEVIIAALKAHRNWYLDLSNERNIKDKRFTSLEDLKELRAFARRLDPGLLVTASHGGDITREELSGYLQRAQIDFISPHRPRDSNSAAGTTVKTKDYLDWMKQIGQIVPVHYQEPFRRGYSGWEPKAEDFLTDLRAARQSGAAGWCFHNGDQRGQSDGQPRRSFDLSERRLFDQFDAEEQKFLERLKAEEKRQQAGVVQTLRDPGRAGDRQVP